MAIHKDSGFVSLQFAAVQCVNSGIHEACAAVSTAAMSMRVSRTEVHQSGELSTRCLVDAESVVRHGYLYRRVAC